MNSVGPSPAVQVVRRFRICPASRHVTVADLPDNLDTTPAGARVIVDVGRLRGFDGAAAAALGRRLAHAGLIEYHGSGPAVLDLADLATAAGEQLHRAGKR